MKGREKKEEENKRIGWLASLGIQLLFLVLCYFIVAWKKPSPPIPEYGIQLNFSPSIGSAAAAPPPPSQENPITTKPPQEQEENTQEENTQEDDTQEVIENEEDIQEDTDIEDSEPVEKEQEIDSRAVMSDTDSDESSDKPPAEEAQEVDQRAIYGNQNTNTAGDTEGASLALSGWVWDFKPKPEDQSNESGKIVYKIVVDKDGYLVNINTIISTVSPTIEKKYRQAVEKITFSETTNYKTASVSTGTITFIIKSK